MKFTYVDEASFVSGETWLALWKEAYANGRRKTYSGERVWFTMGHPDGKSTVSWQEPDPEYAKPSRKVGPAEAGAS